jgi:RNA polymerase sigma-70 factor (ECF subfamily)
MGIFSFNRKNIKSLADEQLILLFVKDKDSLIIDEIYNRYSHLVLGTCMKYLKNKMDAEDLALSIFSKLGDKLIKHEVKHFKSWFYTLTKNECYMLLRKSKLHQVELPDHLNVLNNEVFEEDFEELERKLNGLEKALTLLKSSQKQCIELFYLQKKSYEEIVKITGFTNLQVKSNIQNGKRSLRILMDKNKF